MELLEPTRFVSSVTSSKKCVKEYFEELSIDYGYYD